MLYILDTNILIYPNRISHPIDIHPTYWSKISDILKRQYVISIDKVKDEIYNHEDNLTDWCKINIPRNFWASTANSISEYAVIQNWAQSKKYNERALSEFAESKNADPFLVAFAKKTMMNNDFDVTIVTLELSRPDSIKSIKIPDVCIAFNIRYININDFFREIKVSF
ncbi:DUF4411 family protein [Lacinutrix chionoecetis]